jgi:nicotinamide riboside kinase
MLRVDSKGFIEAIEEALASDSEQARELRSEAMVAGTWEERVRSVVETVEEVVARKR